MKFRSNNDSLENIPLVWQGMYNDDAYPDSTIFLWIIDRITPAKYFHPTVI